uniref:Uncharacterized protein n=1 Tax=Anguilla anguilla TaxID=7936 RepID=A0A0E9QVT6_ANGAN
MTQITETQANTKKVKQKATISFS